MSQWYPSIVAFVLALAAVLSLHHADVRRAEFSAAMTRHLASDSRVRLAFCRHLVDEHAAALNCEDFR